MGTMRRLVEQTVTINDITGTETSDTIDLDGAESISVQCVVDVDTPSAKTFEGDTDVDPTTDQITITAHGLPTGLKGQLTTAGALPTGLSLSTDYFVIVVDADTIKLAESLADAEAGTAVDITADGSGTATFTPTALAGAEVKLEKSNDAANWSDVAAATAITADGTVWLEVDRPAYRYARLSYTLTAGSMSTENHVLVKGSQA